MMPENAGKSLRASVVQTLRDLKPEVSARFKVTSMGLFGSLARSEERDPGDVNLLVDFAEGASLFDLVRLGFFLEDRLNRKVDLIPRESLRPELRESVLRELIHL